MSSESATAVPGFAPLHQQLARSFESPFELWECRISWNFVSVTEGPSSELDQILQDEKTEFHQLLGCCEHGVPGPAVTRLLGDRIVLVVPEITGEGILTAAAGILGNSEESFPLAESLASSIVECRRQARLAMIQQQELNSYAYQVSQNFEELTWLRNLAENLDYCDIANPLEEVAANTVPALKEIIGAEALLLIGNTISGKAPRREQPACGVPLVRSGKAILDEKAAWKLISLLMSPGAGHPVVRNHMQTKPQFRNFPGVESCIMVPVTKQAMSGCVGWLLAVNKKVYNSGPADQEQSERAFCPGEDEFGTVEASLLHSAAVMLATHARNIALLHEKENLLIGVIRALINAMDAKDSYTCGHSDRVALIAKRIGEEMGLSRSERDRLYMTGLLHDIGKIGVPDDILLKRGRLTEEEFAHIKRHPVIAHEILKHLEQLNYVLPGVLHHHESVDGRGYPHGLSGEAIPLAARILAVADSYDAMTSTRPYRTAMPFEKAESIIRDGAGTQWDAAVVESFFRALPDIRQIGACSDLHTRAILRGDSSQVNSVRDESDSIVSAVSASGGGDGEL